MKHSSVLVLCLLVGPALARPNTEPIYYRNTHSNPLEVTEELIPTTNALPLITSSVANADQPKAQGLSGSTESEAPTVTTPGAPISSTAAAAAPGTTQDQQNSRYTKYADDALSSESIIKDFFLKNLANFQQENTGLYETLPSLAEEPNTLRSVSLAPAVQQTSPNWGDPPDSLRRDPQYQHSVSGQRKPVIHKIITKWTDKTQDVFNIDYNGQHGIVTPAHLLNNFGSTTGFFAFPTATPVPVLIVAKPVYPEVSNEPIELSLLDNGYSPEPERDVYPETNVYQSQDDPYQNEPQDIDGYQQETTNDAVYQQDPVDEVYNEPTKTKKKKNKNKSKTKKPEKQQQPISESDPDRPDAAYWNDQVEHIEPTGWQQQQQQDDPYEENDPYADALGALKDESITECTGIRITVNGKESCDVIEVTINRVDEVTKAGAIPPIIPPVVPVVPAPVAAAAAAPEPSAALAAPVANDATLFAAPLEPLASLPIVPPLPPAPSFLTSPIGSLMNSIMAPTRLGSGTSTGPGSGNKNKHKPHDDTALSDPGEGGGSSMLTDASHAMFGMLAAMSAMTPMNIMIIALAALPVIAMVMAGVGAGMYAYSKFTLPPIKNYSTIVLKRPPPVVVSPHRWRRPVVAPPPSSTGWFDFSNMWSNIGWTADDRRSMRKIKRPSVRVQPTNRLSPYRGHQPTTTLRTIPKTATTVKVGR